MRENSADSFESAPSREYAITYHVANQELNRIASKLVGVFKIKVTMHFRFQPLHQPTGNVSWEISHRHAGELAGIGVFGKNDLLLSPKFGSRMQLVSVITDASSKPDKALDLDLCKDSDKCLRACPVGALKGERIVDKNKCFAQHMKVAKELQLGELDICGVCIRVCPVGKTA